MKVFLVEDSRLIRDRLRAVIAEIPGMVVVAEAIAAAPAIEGVLAHCPDVVILDLNLAEGSGLQVLRTVKASGLSAKVVVLTNYSDRFYRSKCQGLGADWFLDKTREFEQVGTILRQLGNDMITRKRGAL